VTDIQLKDKAKVQAQALSGGMKRKLNLGIALCGNSRFLILDEPRLDLQ
jgi:ATP-binding cassette subfamily A (ABC1) protein 3